jgi:hypothetical protein
MAMDVGPFGRVSGAAEAGGSTSRGSIFGGVALEARLLRQLARWARAVEAGCYRRLRDLDKNAPEPIGWRGRPNRVRETREVPTQH